MPDVRAGLSPGGPRDRRRRAVHQPAQAAGQLASRRSSRRPRGYEIVEPYYRSGPLPPVVGSSHREAGTLEFLHRWEELLGGMCRAGFAIEDVIEPLHADAARRGRQLRPSQPVRGALRADQGPAPRRKRRDTRGAGDVAPVTGVAVIAFSRAFGRPTRGRFLLSDQPAVAMRLPAGSR